MRKYFSNFEENKFYAKSGPHLSPFGSKLVAKKNSGCDKLRNYFI